MLSFLREPSPQSMNKYFKTVHLSPFSEATMQNTAKCLQSASSSYRFRGLEVKITSKAMFSLMVWGKVHFTCFPYFWSHHPLPWSCTGLCLHLHGAILKQYPLSLWILYVPFHMRTSLMLDYGFSCTMWPFPTITNYICKNFFQIKP